MKSFLWITAVALAASALFSPVASAHMPRTITISHQMRGCHSWSFANGPSRASLTIRVDRDAGLIIVNNDVMPHKLVQISGPKARLSNANMRHMSARAFVGFSRAGVYTFKTRPGEDYANMKGMKTVGEDNVLRLKVRVT